MSISKPFLVTVELSSGNVLRFAEHTRSRAEAMMSYYLNEIPTTDRATFYDGKTFVSTVRAAGGLCTTIVTPERGAKFSWNDVGGWRRGTLIGSTPTTTKSGEPAFHVREDKEEGSTETTWYVIPAWALVPEAS